MRALIAMFGLACACACGRIGFDARADGATTGDGAITGVACPSFATFCDGFESGDTSAWSHVDTSTGDTVNVQDTLFHSGRFALDAHVAASGTAGRTASVEYDFADQSTGVLAARAWVYATTSLAAFESTIGFYDSNVANYIDASGGDTNVWTATEGNDNTMMSEDHASAVAVVEDTWLCVEIDVTFSASPFVRAVRRRRVGARGPVHRDEPGLQPALRRHPARGYTGRERLRRRRRDRGAAHRVLGRFRAELRATGAADLRAARGVATKNYHV